VPASDDLRDRSDYRPGFCNSDPKPEAMSIGAGLPKRAKAASRPSSADLPAPLVIAARALAIGAQVQFGEWDRRVREVRIGQLPVRVASPRPVIFDFGHVQSSLHSLAVGIERRWPLGRGINGQPPAMIVGFARVAGRFRTAGRCGRRWCQMSPGGCSAASSVRGARRWRRARGPFSPNPMRAFRP
jgi:hypothetical protein